MKRKSGQLASGAEYESSVSPTKGRFFSEGKVDKPAKEKNRSKGTGSLIKNRGRYYLRTVINGKTISKLLRDQNGDAITELREAKKIAASMKSILAIENREQLLTEVAIHKKLKSRIALPMDKTWDEYLLSPVRSDSGQSTLQGYKTILSFFLRWLSKTHPEVTQAGMVTPEIAQEYFTDLNARKVSGRTFNSYRQCLNMIFKHIQKKAGLEENPFASIARKNLDTVSRKEFTEEQVKQIFQSFDDGFWYDLTINMKKKGKVITRRREFVPLFKDQMKVMLALACWTGCRGEDAAQMRWENVDLEKGIIRFTPRKTKRTSNIEVSLPIHANLRDCLEEALGWHKKEKDLSAYILPDVASRFKRNPTGIRKDVQKIITIATGLPVTDKNVRGQRKLAASAYSLHSFRHTFVSFCANAGVSLDIIAEIVGHGSPVMTKHYAHFSNEAKSAIIKALPNPKANKEETDGKNQQKATKKALMEKLSKLSPDKIDELLKLVESE